jgi:hypothetical protein
MKTLNGSTMAILVIGTLAIAALVAACGQPAPVMPAAPADEAWTLELRTGTLAATGPFAPPTDEERLTAMQSSMGILVADSLEHGQVVSGDVFNTIQAIDRAREALRQLDGQRDGLQMLVAQYVAMGTCAPECVFDAIQSVEQARSEALKAVGLGR